MGLPFRQRSPGHGQASSRRGCPHPPLDHGHEDPAASTAGAAAADPSGLRV